MHGNYVMCLKGHVGLWPLTRIQILTVDKLKGLDTRSGMCFFNYLNGRLQHFQELLFKNAQFEKRFAMCAAAIKKMQIQLLRMHTKPIVQCHYRN